MVELVAGSTRSRMTRRSRGLVGFTERELGSIGPLVDRFRLDIGRADYSAPLLGFVGDELVELGDGPTKIRKRKQHEHAWPV